MIRIVDGRWGPCEYFAKDEYVGRSMHYYGEYNPDETEKIIELAGSGLCLDIGANIGVMTQALIATGHTVVSFEPQPEVFKLLERNAANSSISTYNSAVRCVNAAVGNTIGEVDMPVVSYSDKGNFGGIGINSKALINRGTYKVPIVRIDDMDLKNVSFMKIDVEGYELEVLKGATETIKRDKPVLYIEDDRVEKRSALRAYIIELGYTYELHQPLLYREQNYFNHKKNVWDRLYASHNLICKC